MPEPKKKLTTTKVKKNNTSPKKKVAVSKQESKSLKKGLTNKKVVKKSSSTKSKKSKTIVVDVIKDDLDFEVNDKVVLDDFLDSSLSDKEPEVQVEEELERVDTYNNPDDIDSQKKFFQELSLEVQRGVIEKDSFDSKEEDDDDKEVKDLLELFEDEEPVKVKSRPLNIYGRFVWKFLLIVSLLFAFVFYFCFSKLTINIVPTNEILNDSLSLKVSENPTGIKLLTDTRENVFGLVNEMKIEVNKEFNASGEEFVGEEISGRVKIINNYSRNQPLVATTRLASPDNKIYRIKEAVDVPAGGEVWVDIYSTEISHQYAIKPTTFTIPGLWLGLQDKIYAKSEEPFVFEQKKRKYIKPSDISLAEREISNELLVALNKKIEEERQRLKNEKGVDFNYVYTENSASRIKVEGAVNEKKENFLAKAESSFTVVFFSKEESDKLAHRKISSLVPSDKDLLEFNPDSVIYSLESSDLKDSSATVKAIISAKMILKSDGEVIKKENLVNLSADQLNVYLKEKQGIESFDLSFSPSFIKKAPSLVDRIKINVVSNK